MTKRIVIPAEAGIQFLKRWTPAFAGVTMATLLALSPCRAEFTLTDTLENLQLKENEIKTLQFDFKQEIKFTGMDSPSSIEGQAVFQKPKKLRIEKKKPLEQITISDGKKMWVYTPSYKQVWEGNWDGWLKGVALPKGLVPFGDFVQDLRANFDLTLSTFPSPTATTLTIKAVPKNIPQDFSLEFLISTENWLPVQTIYRSETANVLTVLQGMVINNTLDPKIFSFKPPKGTEVIKLN